MKIHVRKHTRESRYKYCGQQFNMSNTLKFVWRVYAKKPHCKETCDLKRMWNRKKSFSFVVYNLKKKW